MLKIELSKLWKSQPFLIFICFVILFNIISLSYIQNLNPTIPLSAYQKFQNTLSEIPNEDRYSYVEDYYKTIKAFEALETISTLSVDSQKNAYLIEDIQAKNPELDNYKKLYENHSIDYYTGQLESDVQMIEDIYEEMKMIHYYPTFLKNVFEQSKTISNISIFQNENLYEQKKKLKTQEDYQQCQDISITYDLEKGIVEALDNSVSHFLIVISMVMIVSYLILDEKDKGLLSFIKTTEKGYTQTIIVKSITMCFSIGLLVIMMTLTQLLYMQMTCGLGDLSRSLQSLVSYQQCPLHLTIREYLIGYMLVRWLVLCCLGMILLWMALVIKNRYMYFLSIIGFFLLEFVLYVLINPLSSLFLFKYFNVIFLLQTDHYFQIYRLVNVFYQPLSLQFIILILIAVVGFIFTILSVLTYNHKEDLFLHYQSFQLKKNHHVSFVLWKQECFKMFWLQKGFLFIIICFLFSCYQMTHIQIYPSYEEKMSMQYLSYLKGPLTDEKETWILQEEKRYQEIHEQYNEIDEKYERGEISHRDKIMLQDSLDIQLQSETVFQDIYQTYQQIKENPHIQFVVPYTYQKLLTDKSWTLLPTVLLVIFVMLSLSHVYSYENMNSMECLIETTLYRKKIRYTKLLISLLMIIVLFFMMFIPLFIPFLKAYGLSDISASTWSYGFMSLPSLPLWVILVFHCILKLIALLCVICVMYVFQIYFKNHLLSLFLSIVIFLFPLLLSYAGFTFFDKFGLYPLLMNGLYFEHTEQLLLSLGLYGAIMVVCCFYILKKS